MSFGHLHGCITGPVVGHDHLAENSSCFEGRYRLIDARPNPVFLVETWNNHRDFRTRPPRRAGLSPSLTQRVVRQTDFESGGHVSPWEVARRALQFSCQIQCRPYSPFRPTNVQDLFQPRGWITRPTVLTPPFRRLTAYPNVYKCTQTPSQAAMREPSTNPETHLALNRAT